MALVSVRVRLVFAFAALVVIVVLVGANGVRHGAQAQAGLEALRDGTLLPLQHATDLGGGVEPGPL